MHRVRSRRGGSFLADEREPTVRNAHLQEAVAALCLTLAVAVPAVGAEGGPPAAQPSELKSLSIEQLMDIDVTSVSRRSEPVSGAAAAITVITGEDVRLSG